MLVQCRKTGRWYNAQDEFNKKMNSPEVLAILCRMKNK